MLKRNSTNFIYSLNPNDNIGFYNSILNSYEFISNNIELFPTLTQLSDHYWYSNGIDLASEEFIDNVFTLVDCGFDPIELMNKTKFGDTGHYDFFKYPNNTSNLKESVDIQIKSMLSKHHLSYFNTEKRRIDNQPVTDVW